MRLTLLAGTLAGVVLTTGCSVVLPPAAEPPCTLEQNVLTGAKAAKSLADAEALEANVKAMNAQSQSLQATIDRSETERAAADTAVKAAESDLAAAKALAERDAKALTEA